MTNKTIHKGIVVGAAMIVVLTLLLLLAPNTTAQDAELTLEYVGIVSEDLSPLVGRR